MTRIFASLYIGAIGAIATIGISPALAQTSPTTQCVASATAGGTSDAIVIPALPCGLTTNLLILTTLYANTTTTPTLQPLGSPAQTIIRADGTALRAGDMPANYKALLNPTGTNWILVNPAISSSTATNSNNLANNGTLSSSGNITTQGTLLQSVQNAFVNHFINGDDSVDQRNAFASQTITTSGAYTDDRWYAYTTGASATGQNVPGTGVRWLRRMYQFTGAASVSSITRCQRIEAANSVDLSSGPTLGATISLWTSNSLLSTVNWTVSQANSTDTFGSLNGSSSTSAIASGSWTVTSSFAQYTASVSFPNTSINTGLQVCFSVGAQTSGAWNLAQAQFEAGFAATQFEHRPLQTELALCQRYFWSYVNPSATASFGAFGFAGTGSQIAGQYYMLPVQMRVAGTPTVIGTWLYINSSVVTFLAYPYGFVVYATSTTSGFVQFYPANASGVWISAEL